MLDSLLGILQARGQYGAPCTVQVLFVVPFQETRKLPRSRRAELGSCQRDSRLNGIELLSDFVFLINQMTPFLVYFVQCFLWIQAPSSHKLAHLWHLPHYGSGTHACPLCPYDFNCLAASLLFHQLKLPENFTVWDISLSFHNSTIL